MMEEMRARQDHETFLSCARGRNILGQGFCEDYVETVSRLFADCDKDNSGACGSLGAIALDLPLRPECMCKQL